MENRQLDGINGVFYQQAQSLLREGLSRMPPASTAIELTSSREPGLRVRAEPLREVFPATPPSRDDTLTAPLRVVCEVLAETAAAWPVD